MAAYKRSIYLINPRFQFKFALFVCSIVLLSSIVYPLTIFDLIQNFTHFLAETSGNEQYIINLEDKKTDLIMWLIVYQSIFILLVFLICIFQSHKIAGPIYKLHKFLRNVADGHPAEKLFFRKGDNFKEIADDFNDAFTSVQDSYNKDFAYLSEIQAYINNLALVVPEDKKPVLKEITTKLTEIQDRFKQ